MRVCIKRWLVVWFWLAASLAAAQEWQIVDSQTIAPGVFYQALWRSNPPTWVGVVRLPLPLPSGLTLTPALGGEKGFDRQPLSRIAATVQQRKGYVAAAINGDYFSMLPSPYTGDPLGLHIQEGELVSFPWANRSALVGLRDGRIVIARFRADAQVFFPDGTVAPLDGLNQPPSPNGLCLFTPTFGANTKTPSGTVEVVATANLPLRPNIPLLLTVRQVSETGNAPIPPDGVVLVATGKGSEWVRNCQPNEQLQVLVNLVPLDAPFDPRDIVWAIAGGPRLLRDGQVSVEWQWEGMSATFAQTKHPRTAVGLKEDALLWVVVDGRQPGYSEGMSLYELAEFLKRAGCKEALNLDGGGSSTLLVRGVVVNRPSDGSERPIANALLLLNLFPLQPLLRLWVMAPTNEHWLAGTPIPFRVMGEDAAYRLLPVNPEEVTLTLAPQIKGWRFDGQTLWLPPLSGEEVIPVTVTVAAKKGDAAPASVTFCLHPKPSSIVVRPNPLAVAPGASVSLQVQVLGRERDGRTVPLRFDPSSLRWQVKGEVGEVRDALFIASRPNGVVRGTLTVTINEVSATVPVCVGLLQWQTLHEFDDLTGVQIVGYPETTKAEGRIVFDNKRSGAGALLFRYDFSQGGKTRTASVVLNRPLPTGTCRLALSVFGDGSGCWLRARIRDAMGKLIFVDFASSINWHNEWRDLEAALPSGLTEPLTLEAIYLAVIRDEQRGAGAVLLDNLRVGISGM